MSETTTTQNTRTLSNGLTMTTFEHITDLGSDMEHVYREHMLKCHCKREVWGGMGDDLSCDCGREYNACGQELRSNWRSNPSNWNDDISDMEGFEMAMADY